MIRMLNCPASNVVDSKPGASVLRHLMGEGSWAALGCEEKQLAGTFHWSSRSYGKGSCLIAQGTPLSTISILLSGWAFRFQSLPEGKRQILDFVFAGALLGFGSGNTNWYGVEAVTACKVASIQYSQFRRLLAGCPALALQVAERVAESEMRAHEHMTGLGRRTARERVAALIVELMTRTKSLKSGLCVGTLELPVTQIMIGDALGLSNEHVCRTLAKLADDGVIELSRNAVRVVDPRAMAIEAGKDLAGLNGSTAQEVWAA